MTDTRRYRRCRYCGAVLGPTDSFCAQCGIDTEQSYEGRMPEHRPAGIYGEPDYGQEQDRSRAGYRQSQGKGQRIYDGEVKRSRSRYDSSQGTGQSAYGGESDQSRSEYHQSQKTGQKTYGGAANLTQTDYDRNRGDELGRYDREFEQRREESGRANERQNRYRQERLESDWSEDWGRPVDEKKMTAMQCVLLVLLVILLAALLALGAFWFFGRSTNRTSGQRGETQAGGTSSQSYDDSDIITILDPQDGDTSADDGSQSGASAQTGGTAADGNTGSDAAQSENTGVAGNQSSDSAQNGSASGDGSKNDDSVQAADSAEAEGMQNSDSTQAGDISADDGSQSGDTAQDGASAAGSQVSDIEQDGASADGSQSGDIAQDGASTGDSTATDSSTSAQNQSTAAQNQSTAASWSQPESSQRLLTADDLAGLDYDGLQMAINEIYARHGRIFKTPEIGDYFESQSWYEGTLDADHFDESVFSDIENQNIQIILEAMGDN